MKDLANKMKDAMMVRWMKIGNLAAIIKVIMLAMHKEQSTRE